MSFFNTSPPRLPAPPPQYDAAYVGQMLNVLNLFFQQLTAVQSVNIAQLNINITTLPTDADLANLRVGDVYRDIAGGNVLKIKV
jgi:hypothetical protein